MAKVYLILSENHNLRHGQCRKARVSGEMGGAREINFTIKTDRRPAKLSSDYTLVWSGAARQFKELRPKNPSPPPERRGRQTPVWASRM